MARGSSAEDPSSQREMAGALQSSPLRPYRVFEHICTTTPRAPADGSVCMLGGAPIEVGAPCAGTSNVDDRARMKCDHWFAGFVRMVDRPPASAADLSGTAREDMRFPREASRARRKNAYVISSGRACGGSARPPKLQLDVFSVTHPLDPLRACTRTGWERSRTLERSPCPPGRGST